MNLKFSFVLLILAVQCIDSSHGLVGELQKNEFFDFVKSESYVLVLFRSGGDCSECTQASEYLGQVPQSELLGKDITKKSVSDEGLAEQFGVTAFPSVVFFRKSYPALYDGKLGSPDDVPDLVAWIESALDVATKDLYEDSFEHLTQASTGATTGDWFVMFYDPDCECCRKHLPALETAAIRQKYRMNFAKVDVKANKKLADRFKITKEPTSILFKQGKMYHYEPEKYEPQALVAFTDSWYKNVKASIVPHEPTGFDALTDNIADYLKENLNDPGKKWIIIGAVVVTLLLIVFVVKNVFKEVTRQKYD